ncbi:MAG: Grx4 family monothiol glutaredoxin [Gammaproteobacteria bacterium]|nr:Grx4 family monothiol glutaredoxin [Gammaproteobacteria bacterium]
MDVNERIGNLISSNGVMLFMKGDRRFPMCGFSGQAIQLLESCGAVYETLNVLEDDEIRQGIKAYSSWPTIPQLYVGGEFVGGSDIMMSLHQQGELQRLIKETQTA